MPAIGRRAEQPLRHLRKRRRRGERQIFLALEVSEERAIAGLGCAADVVHRGCRVALRARSIRLATLRRTGASGWVLEALMGCHPDYIPTGWYLVKTMLPADGTLGFGVQCFGRSPVERRPGRPLARYRRRKQRRSRMHGRNLRVAASTRIALLTRRMVSGRCRWASSSRPHRRSHPWAVSPARAPAQPVPQVAVPCQPALPAEAPYRQRVAFRLSPAASEVARAAGARPCD
jgi:hypothetical protein